MGSKEFLLHGQSECLDNLTKRTGQHVANNTLNLGNVALLLNEKKTRLKWPIGGIEEMYTGKNKVCRSVLLILQDESKPVSKNRKRKNKEDEPTQPHFVRRGIEQIAMLEAGADLNEDVGAGSTVVVPQLNEDEDASTSFIFDRTSSKN